MTGLRPDAPNGVDEVLARGLEKDPSARYPSAGAFVEALAAVAVPKAAPHEEPGVPGGRTGATGRAESAPPADSAESSEPATWIRAIIEAAQLPTVVICLSLAALSAGYALILAPETGNQVAAVTLAAAAAVLSAMIIARRSPAIHERLIDRRVAQWRRQHDELERQELERLDESLRLGFTASGSSEGADTVQRLTLEYQQTLALIVHEAGTSFAMAQVQGVATETYRRGLSILVDALEMLTAASRPGPERIRIEMEALQREIAALERAGNEPQRLAIRVRALESHRERLGMLEDLRLRIEQLFYHAGQCEAALHRTRITVAAMRAGNDSVTNIEPVIRALQRATNQARDVQEEVRKLGY